MAIPATYDTWKTSPPDETEYTATAVVELILEVDLTGLLQGQCTSDSIEQDIIHRVEQIVRDLEQEVKAPNPDYTARALTYTKPLYLSY